MRRIGPLPTACLEQAGLPDALQQGVQSPLLGIALHQPGPAFTPHGMVNSCVREGYPSGVLPIDAAPHSVGRAAIRQALDTWRHGHQRQSSRGFSWLSTRRKQGRKVCVLVEGPEGISQPQTESPFGECRASDTLRFFRNLIAALRVSRHGQSSVWDGPKAYDSTLDRSTHVVNLLLQTPPMNSPPVSRLGLGRFRDPQGPIF
jgi:hypothetical protein